MRVLMARLGLVSAAVLGACSAPAAPPVAPAQPTAPPASGNTSAAPRQGVPGPSSTLQDLIAGAAKEGQLSATWSQDTYGGAQGFPQIVDAMNKKYGLQLKSQWAPGASMNDIESKILQEVASGQPASTDVYVGTDAHFPTMRAQHALLALGWQKLSDGRITTEVAEPGNVGVKIISRFVGVPYNTNLVKGDDIPQQLSDVIKPKWKGKIASTSYAAELYVLPAPKLVGVEKMDKFMQEFSPLVGGFIRCGEEQRVASGEFAMLVLDCGSDPTDALMAKGAPIAHAYMKDAALINMDRLGVPANSAHPNAAALFILYLSSPEGQQLVYSLQKDDLHLYPETHAAQRVAELKAQGYNFTAVTETTTEGIDSAAYQKKYSDMMSAAAQH